jgi:uncharacterized protein
MRGWIRSLSFRAEFAIVVVAAFGLAVVGIIQVLVSPRAARFTNVGFLRGLIFEVVVGCLLWQFLRLRGWTAEQVGLPPVRPSRRALLTTTLVALGLMLAAQVSYWILAITVLSVSSDLAQLAWTLHPRVAPNLSTLTVLAVAVINAPFEEVFECGYVISSLRERLGVTTAVNVSAGIRIALHLYQGPIGVLSITPFALIAAYWFARTRRLAPLIVAHALVDFTGLSLASRWG